MEGGLDREKSNLEGWSEDRKQCGHSTAVAGDDSLFWENLTQRNKGFVVVLSV